MSVCVCGVAGAVQLLVVKRITPGDGLLELGGSEIGWAVVLAGRGRSRSRSRIGRVARWRVGLLRLLLRVWLDGHLHCHVGGVSLRCLQHWLLLLTLLGRTDNLRVLRIVVVVGIGWSRQGGGLCRRRRG